MNNYEWNKLRRSVIAKAWITEKLRISKGEGTRNWLVVHSKSYSIYIAKEILTYEENT